MKIANFHQFHLEMIIKFIKSDRTSKAEKSSNIGIGESNRHWIHRACTMRATRPLEKAGSHTWCHILPGMLSKRLLDSMEYLVRARLLRVLEAASRETSPHGWSILLTHALYKFSKVHTKDTRGPCVRQPSNGIR